MDSLADRLRALRPAAPRVVDAELTMALEALGARKSLIPVHPGIPPRVARLRAIRGGALR